MFREAIKCSTNDHREHGEHLLIVVLGSDVTIPHGGDRRPQLAVAAMRRVFCL